MTSWVVAWDRSNYGFTANMSSLPPELGWILMMSVAAPNVLEGHQVLSCMIIMAPLATITTHAQTHTFLCSLANGNLVLHVKGGSTNI